MTKDLLVRGFDDQTHAQLGKIAEKSNVSLNSIVKDAVDKWLNHYSQVAKKHDLILYSDNQSMLHLLKTMDVIAKDSGWFRCFCGPSSHSAVKLLHKLNWFDSTAHPYNISEKNIGKFFGQVIEKTLKAAKGQQLCLLDLVIEDFAKTSLKEAIKIEHGYNSSRLAGAVFCPYRLDNLMSKEITTLMDLFETHDQIFILRNNEIYKMHVTHESIHKLFLS